MINIPWPTRPDQSGQALAALVENLYRKGKPFEALMRCVVSSVSGVGVACFGRIDLVRYGEKGITLPIDEDLGTVRVVSEKVDPASFADRLLVALRGEPLWVGGEEIGKHGATGQWTAHRLIRTDYREGNPGLPWPCRVFQLDHFGTNIPSRHSPLTSATGYYSDYVDLVRKVSGLRPFHGQSDARLNALLLFVWDYTARVAGVANSEAGVEVHIEGDDIPQVVVAGKVTSIGGSIATFRMTAAVPTVLVSGEQAREVEVGLFSETDQVDWDRIQLPTELESVSRSPLASRSTWNVLEQLGQGGQGTAYLVRHERGQTGVLKELRERDWPTSAGREKALKRFRREIEVTQSLDHPLILRVLAADPSGANPWVVTQHMPLGPLERHLRLFRGDVLRTMRVARDVAFALSVLHARELVHRDVKPDNILLRDPDRAVLGDFGIVHIGDRTVVTSADEKVGPHWFMPPEAEVGRYDDPDATFDVYSLGKVIWCMLSGGAQKFIREAFRGKGADLVQLLERPELEQINRLLDRMINPDQGARFESMDAVIRGIDLTVRQVLVAGAPPAETKGRAGLIGTLPRLRAMLGFVDRHLRDVRAVEFAPSSVDDVFSRYGHIREDLIAFHSLEDLPPRMPRPSDDDGWSSGGIPRADLEALRADVVYAITVIEESRKLA